MLYQGECFVENKTCCFIGHSKIWEDISQALAAAVERHITEYGVYIITRSNRPSPNLRLLLVIQEGANRLPAAPFSMFSIAVYLDFVNALTVPQGVFDCFSPVIVVYCAQERIIFQRCQYSVGGWPPLSGRGRLLTPSNEGRGCPC